MLTVTFEGLCALHEGRDQWSVYTPIGMHSPHTSLLAVAGSDLDGANTNWMPDFTTNDPHNGDQICLWRLAGTQLQMSPAGIPAWSGDAAAVVNFPTINPGSKFAPGNAAASGGVIVLGAGTVSVTDNVTANPRLSVMKGKAAVLSQKFAERVAWSGPPLIGDFGNVPAMLGKRAYLEDLNTHRKIVFHTDQGASVYVTNSMPSRDALAHFHSYYDLIQRAPGDVEAQMVDLNENAMTGINCVPLARMPQ